MGDALAEMLRADAPRLAERWEARARRELPQIAGMSRPLLIDHLYEVIDGLAAWIDGETEDAERAFEALASGHALQRLGHGIPLETLLGEYACLRAIVSETALALPCTEDVRRSSQRFHAGLDRAIARAIARYAQSRDEVRDRFIGILGHDLRSPLGTISMSAQIVRDQRDPKEIARLADRIDRAAERMRRMIGDLLDFASAQLGGGIPVTPTLNDLGELCRAAIDAVAGAHPDREIVASIEGDLRGAFDRERVLQALGNLLENAITHGTGRIEVAAHEEHGRAALVTAVTSHGSTIPAELARRIFDPFSRGNDADKHTGLGLGLFIVEQIALAHGATCTVTSADDATTFTIR